MKITILITSLILAQSAFASSYWYDDCDAVTPAYEAMRKYNPSVDIAPENLCQKIYSRQEAMSAACLQRIAKVYSFKNKAKFLVNIDTENSGILNYVVRFKGSSCRLLSVKKLVKSSFSYDYGEILDGFENLDF